MILSLLIALKFHKGAKNNTLLSFVSYISIISIILGIIISIITLNIICGFNYELHQRLLSVIPHGEVKPKNIVFTDWKDTLAHIKEIPHVVDATPYISLPGVIEYNNRWHVVHIKGVDLIQNAYFNKLCNFIEESTLQNFCKYKKQIILGKGILNALRIKPGNWITVHVTNSKMNSNKRILSSKKICFQVSGALDINGQLDYSFAAISLLDAQYYCNSTSEIDGIAVQVDNIFCAEKIMRNIEHMIDDSICAQSWMDKYGYIYHDIQMIRVIVYLSMMLIIGLSCFNIVATLILSINNKLYDILILRALGMSNILIQGIFCLYGIIIYIISSIIGVGISIFISLNLTSWIEIFNRFLGKKIFLENIYFVNFLPIKIDIWNILVILGATFMIGIFASWYATTQIKKVNFVKLLK